MAEFYDIYPKDRWKDPSYHLMDKFSLKGKKGVVTGGGGGIGRNVAAAWAEAGADVALVDIPSSKERLEPLCKEMSERYGVKIIPLYCDVSTSWRRILSRSLAPWTSRTSMRVFACRGTMWTFRTKPGKRLLTST